MIMTDKEKALTIKLESYHRNPASGCQKGGYCRDCEYAIDCIDDRDRMIYDLEQELKERAEVLDQNFKESQALAFLFDMIHRYKSVDKDTFATLNIDFLHELMRTLYLNPPLKRA